MKEALSMKLKKRISGRTGQTGVAILSGTQKESPKASIVIPTLNEEKTIREMLRSLPETYEIVLADSSTDDTVSEALKSRPDAIVLKVPPVGKGLALRLGARRATCDVIIFMDGDGSHTPAEIDSLLSALNSGYDIAVASRMPPLGWSQEHSSLHYCGNKLVTWMINILFRGALTDSQNGFRAVRRNVLDRMELKTPGFTFETEMSCRALKKRFKIVEVPSLELKRKAGSPKMSLLKVGWRHFARILVELILR